MNPCPELHELHDFVDGQLSGARWYELDLHQRDCGACRDALRSIARLNRVLMRNQKDELGADFEERFREGLLSRMVSTDDVGRLRRFQRRDLVLAAGLAALLMVALTLGIRRLVDDEVGLDARGEVARFNAPSRETRLGLREAVARYLDGLGPEGPNADDPGLTALSLRFNALGQSLVRYIEDEADVSAPDRESAALKTLGRLGDSQATSALQRHLERRDIGTSALLATLESLVALKTENAARRIHDARQRLEVEDGIRLLAACDNQRGQLYLRELAEEAAEQKPQEVARALAAIEGHEITMLLFDLARTHEQTDAFAEALAGRPDALASLRRIAFRSTEPQERRTTALAQLGRMKDEESRAVLVSLVRDRRLHPTAVMALADLGGPAAVTDVVLTLRIDGRDSIGSLLDRNGAALSALMRLRDPARAEIRRALRAETCQDRAAYLLALGRVAETEDLPLLFAEVEKPAFEQAAIAALTLLDGEQVRAFLQRLLRHRDADLRRRAREALEVLEAGPEEKRRWKGFAALDDALFDAPTHV